MSEFDDIVQQMAGRSSIASCRWPACRARRSVATREIVSFSSNNYLALASSRRLIEAAGRRSKIRRGNCESRLLGGDLDIYRKLEDKLARLKARPPVSVRHGISDQPRRAVHAACARRSPASTLSPTKHYSYAYFTDECNHISIAGHPRSGADKITYLTAT